MTATGEEERPAASEALVASLAAAGLTCAEIADRLSVEESAVAEILGRIYRGMSIRPAP